MSVGFQHDMERRDGSGKRILLAGSIYLIWARRIEFQDWYNVLFIVRISNDE